MQYNRAFEEMMRPAREWLAGKDPQEIAARSGVQYDVDAQAFRMRVLGSEYVVRWPEWTVEDVQAGWKTLVLLHYLNRADGMTETNADLSAVFEFMPRYPLMLKIWLADDEWGASGKLLLDRSADHYLPVEDAVTVGEIFWRN